MNELHIHEVLHMMQQTQKTYSGKADFVKDISEKFGSDAHFFACSAGGMNADEAFEFLIRKGKISLNSKQLVDIDPNMTLCDDDHNHNHDHHHSYQKK
ncbi:MAG: metal-binding protein [Draconibacterium sp.]|nr:MAG: metal-binding protein [Draconibacterium sp.]